MKASWYLIKKDDFYLSIAGFMDNLPDGTYYWIADVNKALRIKGKKLALKLQRKHKGEIIPFNMEYHYESNDPLHNQRNKS